MTDPGAVAAGPHWVQVYVDGGVFRAGRHTARTRGVYWSMLCEETGTAPDRKPVLVRRQDYHYRTNNDAEWLALREGLEYAAAHHATMPVIIYSDSRVIVNQFNGVFKVKLERHHRLRSACRALAERCKFVVVQWVPREVLVAKVGH